MEERGRHTVTQVSSDDWNWVYVDGDLVYEGHENLDTEVFTILSRKIDMNLTLRNAYIDDYDLVMSANKNASTLDEFFALGLTKDNFK